MQHATVNMNSIFNELDMRLAKAESIIQTYSVDQVSEASRIASIYNKCHKTSLKHKEDIVKFLTESV